MSLSAYQTKAIESRRCEITTRQAFERIQKDFNAFVAASTPGSGPGTVTTVSVATANGISGTVATATTTPVITLAIGTLPTLTVTAAIVGSVTGNAATVTNGVYTTGSYADPAWLTSLAATKITGSFAGLTLASGVLTLPNGTAAACAVNFGTAGTGLFGDATRVFVSVAGTYAAYFTATAFILGTVTNIQNSSGKQHVAFTNVGATSVNYFTMTQSATGNPLQLNFTGDTNGSIYAGYKGTGGFRIGVAGSAANATARLHLPAGSTTIAALKWETGTDLTTPVAGTSEYNGRFTLTDTDAARRFIVQAAASTKTVAAAPYANDGYIVVNINGTDVKLMTTA
jgi:hypothetical protein